MRFLINQSLAPQAVMENRVLLVFLAVSLCVHGVVFVTDWFEFKLPTIESLTKNKTFSVRLLYHSDNKPRLKKNLQRLQNKQPLSQNSVLSTQHKKKSPLKIFSNEETDETAVALDIMQQAIDFVRKDSIFYNAMLQKQRWDDDVTSTDMSDINPSISYRHNNGDIHTKLKMSWATVCFVNRMQNDTQEFDFPLLNYEACATTKKKLDLSRFDKHD